MGTTKRWPASEPRHFLDFTVRLECGASISKEVRQGHAARGATDQEAFIPRGNIDSARQLLRFGQPPFASWVRTP